jgi:hypothetical protein
MDNARTRTNFVSRTVFNGTETRNMQKKVMKKQFLTTIIRRGSPLSLCCLAGTSLVVNAQQSPSVVQFGVVASTDGSAVVIQYAQQLGMTNSVMGLFAPSGGGQGFFVSLEEIGHALVTACNTNGNGEVTRAELKTAALTWFNYWDTDTNGALSPAELLTGLQQLLPEPQPPPGLQPPPEGLTPAGHLAKKIFTLADTDNDGSLTFAEVSEFLDGNFARWDLDGNGSLNAQECALAFDELFRPDFAPGSVMTGGAAAGGGATGDAPRPPDSSPPPGFGGGVIIYRLRN